MNRQARSLREQGLCLHFNKGADFSHLSGRERAAHPEFTLVPFEQAHGVCVDSAKERRETHRKPWQGVPKARRKDGIQRYVYY